ncbi:chemotaxis protein methyltransferase CheR [Virgibacillus halotolerans]|uniref:CheR family methyltransferase n=1 Tax=Virgibacillus halotolerans TaxID=1071053 RepID=UPI001961AF2E|nr:protein-glutamate O-methyltransferase CheR [Virgibacillus halotolerans]MBM7598359.1 chemotaxis protein methyltransferase CheR [Virgibacillus halotolerans]
MPEYIDFISRIKLKLGIDLNLYKETQMRRRITTLRNKRGYPDFSSYFTALTTEETLLQEFLDRLTINVTEFYRNPKRWDILQKRILPLLTKQNKQMTIWSAACSTGEEPYSLAIMMKENFPNIACRIIATDLDENVLKKAKQGTYQAQALRELPPTIKKKYFAEQQGMYKIKDTLKEMIRFKQHNLLADAYPSDVDLIVCRNVLIYFTDDAKAIIYHRMGKALRQSGVLFVGSTEQIFSPTNYNLDLIETFFYQKV